jgi:hypothetical protein
MALRALTATLAVTGFAIGVIFVPFVYPGYLAGVSGCPTRTAVDDRTYCTESVTVEQCPVPSYGCPYPGPGFGFQGVDFNLHLFVGSGPAMVGGSISEANSTHFQFSISGNPLGPLSVNWTSPDRTVIILWAAPFTAGPEGGMTATLTCGVLFGTMARG